MIRVASAGLIGVSMIGQFATNRARSWCKQRRGRQQVDAQGNPIPLSPLSIHSNPSSSGNNNTIAQLEEAQAEIQTWKTEIERLQDVIQEQTDGQGKWIMIAQDLDANIKKIERDNLDMKTHMDTEIKNAEKAMENNCQKIWSSKMARMTEEKENELRITQLQIAKQKRTTEGSEEEMQEAVQQEMEFQNNAYKQIAEQEAEPEQRTRAACSTIGNALQCYIGSVDNVQYVDKYNDELVELIVRREIQNKDFVLVGNRQMYTKDALADIGTEPKRRALARINAHRGAADGKVIAGVGIEKKEEVNGNLEKRFDKAFAAEA